MAMAQPEMSPPPLMGITNADVSGRCFTHSRPSVPWPAMMSGSSKALITYGMSYDFFGKPYGLSFVKNK